MCESQLEAKYRNLAQGTTLLESSLHINIAEHVNSEIGLGTITDVESAKAWLRNSFLFQRLQRNPKHYAIGKDEQQTWQEHLDQMILGSVTELKTSKLVETPEDGEEHQLCSTEYGDIMSKVRRAPLPVQTTVTYTHTVLHQAEYGQPSSSYWFQTN